ncbi:MAG: InlB B-repeat-containing protein [Bacteroidales bacterium]|nr:InlB B-repeat-containing protein [Bacteroidales bacterium]
MKIKNLLTFFAVLMLFASSTASAQTNINLSTLTGNYTAQDGEILSGTTSQTITIADDASITLYGATITGGIVCEGSATITLVGTNIVNVSNDNLEYKKAGIQIGGSGTTLTIRGNGSLTATGGSAAAGIGLGRTWDASVTAGSIIIEGGTVTASGDIGIGIGTVGNSQTAAIDGISIKGGTVNASLGKGYLYYGVTATVGYIKVYDTIDMVDASKITETVTYMHGDDDVTANKTDYFTIGEDGERRIITPKDDTDYTITIADGIENGTITAAATAKYMETVTVTATPTFGYRLSRLIVKDADNNDIATNGNTFLMPKGNVTVSAEFEQGTHGTTEFKWVYPSSQGYVTEATIYDGVTTVNIQQTGAPYSIRKYDGYTYYKFRLDNDNYEANIPYDGGTGEFYETGNGTSFSLPYDGETGYYDITLTDVGNGKWGVSILHTPAQMDVVPDQTYTGSAITPEPLVIAGSLSLTKGTDYVYSYTNNTNVGTAKVRATFQGDYASLGYVEKEFTILPPPVVVNVTGNGTVTYNDKVATNGEVIGVVAEKGTDVTLTLTPGNGYAVSIEYGYTNSGTTASGIKLPINGTTATLTVPNDLKDGTYVTMTVSFVSVLAGGADEASAVALTGNTVTNFAGGWYKVDSDITFDHTLNLLGDTHLIIDDGKTMTVNTASGKAIDSEYTLNVSGAGALNITTDEAYKIAVRVGSYVQTGATVTASGYIGIRCMDNFEEFNVTNDFTFSGGQLTATGSGGYGIWADNDISLSCTNATDFIYASSYSSIDGAVKIAEGKALTDGTNTYENTISSSTLKALTNVTLRPVTITINFDSKGGSEVDPQTIVFGSVANEPDAPTRDGYTFDGWYLNGSIYDFSTAVTDNNTLTAVWKKVIGALTLTEDQNGIAATINGAYTGADAFAIGEDIEVASVTFNRTFTTSATSTIILPFDITEGNYSGGDFYTLKSVENNTADMTKVTSVTAHTPYLFVPTGETFSITGNVTIKATTATEYATESEDGKWEFKGIYQRKRWGAEDGDNKDYCFAANAIDDISVGEFVKIGTYVQVKPFRCYLTRKNDISKSAEQLPETIKIRLIDETASVITPDDPQENTGDITTPVSEIANNNGVKVWSYDGAIYIESAPATAYTIVDMTGRALKNGVTNSTRETVTLSRTAGIVIVIINGKTFKVNY